MERDELGRPLTKTGQCPICRKRTRVLADEDFDCCESYEKEEEIDFTPAVRLINYNTCDKPKFTAKDIIMAMIGQGWKDIKALRYEIRSIGFDNVMMIDEDFLIKLLEDLEEDGFIGAYWDTERVKRIERE